MTRFTATAVLLLTTLAQSASAHDFNNFHNVQSRLLLGVYAIQGNGGMRVTGTIPGYSAEGRLFPGDVLMRATMDGFRIYHLRSHVEMENAKSAIGPFRQAALELWRPGVGLMYAWVEFTPVGGIMPYSAPAAAPYQAQFRMESERPGARRLFQQPGTGGWPQGGTFHPLPQPRTLPMPTIPAGTTTDPGRLFGR